LNRAGYLVVVYDSADKPGGLLRFGIPDFKLEKWVLDRRIDLMKKEGVVFELGLRAGDDVSFRFLNQRFAAVALCCGAQEPRDLPIPGRELSGVHFATPFLVGQNRRVADDDRDDSPFLDAAGKHVVVIGGGDTGSDCIGTAVRQGAKKIYQLEILPKPPFERPKTTPWPDWPKILRTSSSHEEAECERLWQVATQAFTGRDGAVSGLTYAAVDWRKTPDGVFRPVPKSGSEHELTCELVLLAMGFVGPAKSPLFAHLKPALSERGNVRVDRNHMTSIKGVFAGGDISLGQSLIVSALADGRKTAAGIIRYLTHA
jgi:glutamate synthase (NADPH/NADH) small chain